MNSIILKNVSKRFLIKETPLNRLKYILNIKEKKKNYNTLLNNINLNIKGGDIVGLFGENGIGKSTLLRLISGIYKPSKGKIKITGKIFSMINIYVCFKQDMNLKDNIYYLYALFGEKRKKIKKSIKKIIAYSELKNYNKIKHCHLSNGMSARFSFSCALNSNSDIILFDESFVNLSSKYKEKYFKDLKKFAKNGGIIIISSHDEKIIKSICNKFIYLNNKTIEIGNKSLLKKYFK